METLYIDKKKMFSVKKDEEAKLYLLVVIGGIFMREKKILMDDNLISLYESDFDRFIEYVGEVRRSN